MKRKETKRVYDEESAAMRLREISLCRLLRDIEEVWWLTQRSVLARIRSAATSCTSCIMGQCQRKTRH